MIINSEKPEGCKAVTIGHIIADGRYDEKAQLMILCGDRKLESDVSRHEVSAIMYPELAASGPREIEQNQKLQHHVAELLTGFCVFCPNNLPPVEST